MRLLTHVLGIVVCSGAFFLLALWSVSMSLQTFAVGGGVEFTREQHRDSAIGDAFLRVYLAPAKLLGLQEREAFLLSALAYGLLIYCLMQVVFRWNAKRRLRGASPASPK